MRIRRSCRDAKPSWDTGHDLFLKNGTNTSAVLRSFPVRLVWPAGSTDAKPTPKERETVMADDDRPALLTLEEARRSKCLPPLLPWSVSLTAASSAAPAGDTIARRRR